MANIWHPFTQHFHGEPPLKVIRGKGVYLTLEDGREIIDGISSWWVNLHGHAHPDIAEAIAEQAKKLEHVIFAGFVHEPAEKLTEILLSLLPKPLNRVFFSDNGSTAVEVAIKMAWQYYWNLGEKQRNILVAFDGAYHGDTFGAMSCGAKSTFFAPFESLMFDVKRIPYVDLEALERLLRKHQGEVVGVLIEPLIQGTAGMRMCQESSLLALKKLTESYDTLLLFDEVMTGFGRTGDYFAANKSQVTPDIIALSKGITGGFLPLAVTVTTDKIYNAFLSQEQEKTFYHGHSYTANPLGCAAAIASCQLLQKNKHQFRSLEKRHQKRMKVLQQDSRLHKARVKGTVAAIDIKVEKEGYFSAVGQKIKPLFLEENVLLRPLGNVIYLMPPYCIEDDELDRLYQAIPRVLDRVS